MVVNLTDRENHNVAAIYDASGEQVLANLKYHMAPGEEKTAGWSANSLDGTTAYTCYDVHYVDIIERIGDNHRVFVLLNDSDFASTQKTLHKADMAFRAVQTRADIAASLVDGPTAFIDRYGRVVEEVAYDREGYVVS